jgi:hypothetical protein
MLGLWRPTVITLVSVLTVGLSGGLVGCGTASPRSQPSVATAPPTSRGALGPTGGTEPSGSIPPTETTQSPPPTTVATTTDPGLLPQTPAEPSNGAALQSSMQILWNAIVAGSPDSALGVFFPRTAYLTMKTGVIADPSADYADRLLAFYDLDIMAYHDSLAPDASTDQLVGVTADANYASWILPGTCENLIGYWHLPGVRLVYSDNGTVRSFAVASLISWHSVWYVVHLGPNPRPSNVGTVDAPAVGPGIPGPAGGC